VRRRRAPSAVPQRARHDPTVGLPQACRGPAPGLPHTCRTPAAAILLRAGLQRRTRCGTMTQGVIHVRIFMRIPQPREWRFEGRRSVRSILEELNINPETVIVICGDTLLTPDDVVEGDVEVEIRPAISGGSGR